MCQKLWETKTVRDHRCRNLCVTDLKWLNIGEFCIKSFIFPTGTAFCDFSDIPAQKKTGRDIHQFIADFLPAGDFHFCSAPVTGFVFEWMDHFFHWKGGHQLITGTFLALIEIPPLLWSGRLSATLPLPVPLRGKRKAAYRFS